MAYPVPALVALLMLGAALVLLAGVAVHWVVGFIRGWRHRARPDWDATRKVEPIVKQLAERAGIVPPRVTVVRHLSPTRGSKHDAVGTNLGTTQLMPPWRAPRIRLDRAALTELSDAGLRALVGHGLGHATRTKRRRYLSAVAGPACVLLLFLVISAGSAANAPFGLQRAGTFYGATVLIAMLALSRREELRADRVGVEITADVAGTEELLDRYEQDPFYAATGPRWRYLMIRTALAVAGTHPHPETRRRKARAYYATLTH